MNHPSTKRPALAGRVAIVGGGLAGLAAAAAAVEQGCRVELFERSNNLGGRAASFVEPQTGELIDYCQHVAMGCCTEFLDFCRRTRIDDCFHRTDKLHFIGPDGRQCDFAPSRWLPAPLHLLPGLMRLSYLSLRERCSIIRTIRRLIAADSKSLDSQTIAAWLRRENQSERAIERFWSAVLVSALGETVDHASLAAAQKVFRDGFCASREASTLLLPRRTLLETFHDGQYNWLANHGAKVHLDAPVWRVEGDGRRARELILRGGAKHEFDFVVVAVPWQSVRSLFAENLLSQMPALANLERIQPAAITAVHLWFDRPITPLPHAVLVGRLSQWLFARRRSAERYYYQVVISASHRLPPRTNDQWLADVHSELQSVWPQTRQARLLHGRVVTLPSAVFSMTPDIELLRPPQRTPLENLSLAGDWTSTGWPATMESAVRSGQQAVETLLGKSAGG
jgi:squalene-associated FAD-dependent desaturase